MLSVNSNRIHSLLYLREENIKGDIKTTVSCIYSSVNKYGSINRLLSGLKLDSFTVKELCMW